MKVLVTGATGFIGRHLVEALLAKNCTVACTCRKTSNTKHLELLSCGGNLQIVNYDLGGGAFDDASTLHLIDALRDVDYVYHLAGLVKAYSAEEYDRANFLGTKSLLEAVVKSNNKNLKRFLYLSSLAATGPAEDINGVDEESQCRPVSLYGASKLKGEIIANQYKHRIPITIVRPPPVYGPGDAGLFFFFSSLAKGIKPQFTHRKYASLIYVDDLVNAILVAAESDKAVGQTYFAADREPYSVNRIVDIIGKAMNGRSNPVRVRLGDRLISGLAGLYEGFCKVIGEPASIINNQKAIELKQIYWICRTDKIKMDLGFETSVPILEGMEKTARWYIDNRWI